MVEVSLEDLEEDEPAFLLAGQVFPLYDVHFTLLRQIDLLSECLVHELGTQ